MYEDIDTQLLSTPNVTSSPLHLYTTLYFQSKPTMAISSVMLTQALNRLIAITTLDHVDLGVWATIFDKSPGASICESKIQAAYRVKNAGFTPRASICESEIQAAYRVKNAGFTPRASICDSESKIQAARRVKNAGFTPRASL
jgi:hypothetical protein